jgi:DNA topoisomerase-1
MAPCKLENKTIKIGETPNKKEKESLTFIGKHSKIIYDGYMKVMNMYKKNSSQILVDGENLDNEDSDDSDDSDDAYDSEDNKINKQSNYLEKVFDKLKKGDPTFVKTLDSLEKYTKPKESRYNEASLIKKMESMSLGRPSTYASMIKKIQETQREYVQKKTIPSQKVDITRITFSFPNIINTETNQTLLPSDKNKLVPTSLGIMVNSFLKTNFIEVLNYDFIKTTEALLDKISLGEEVWYKVVDSVYLKLTPIIDLLDKNIQSRKLLKSADPNANTSSRRNLGLNPQNNLHVFAIKSKKGYLIVEENPEKKQSRFANFSSSFEDMTLETALSLLVFPKILGQYKEHDIIIKKASNIYMVHNNSNYSIENYLKATPQSNIDPESITLQEAKTILDYYEKAKADKVENDKLDKKLSDDITIKKGPFGLYIKYKGESNIKLPKKYKDDIDSLTLELALEIIEKDKTKPKSAAAKGKSAPKGKPVAKPAAKSAAKAAAKPKSAPKAKAEAKPKSAPKPKAVKVKAVKNKF